ncbi:ATP-dependent RNA helicase HrpB, partial [Klebsiella pneumoniae]
QADPDAIAAALLAGIHAHGLVVLPWSDAALALRHRAAFAQDHGGAEPALDDAALLARADEWLTPLLVGKRRLDAIDSGALTDALRALIGWDAL